MMQSRFVRSVHSKVHAVWTSGTTALETEVPSRLAVLSFVIRVSWDAESPVLGIFVWMILHAIQAKAIEVASNLPFCMLYHAFPQMRA